MPRHLRLTVLTATILVLAGLLVSLTPSASAFHGNPDTPPCIPYDYGNPTLFYNFYVPPTCGGVGAELYVAPRPVPEHVGHTYYTYQPLMPHEYTYPHHRRYYRYYNGGRGMTRTHVGYHRSVPARIYDVLSVFHIPR